MKTESFDGKQERLVLAAVLTDDRVARAVASRWEGSGGDGLFPSRWANVVAGWAVKYALRHGKAPNRDVEALHARWAVKNRDKQSAALVAEFLSSLSSEYGSAPANSEHALDQAGELFNRARQDRLADAIREATLRGDSADDLISAHRRVELGTGAGIDVLSDDEALKRVFAEPGRSIVTYPKAAGHFFGDTLDRDCFVSFMGPPGRGKTWALIDLAWRAMLSRLRVLFFELGDMTEPQVMRRFAIRASGLPKHPGTVRVPVKLTKEGDAWLVEHEQREFARGLSYNAAKEAFERLKRRKIKSDRSFLKLHCHPAGSVTVAQVKEAAERYGQEGWPPDVIVLDYADLLAPPKLSRDPIQQIAENWLQLRALSQTSHTLLVTATQSNAGSYKVDTLGMQHFTGAKQKLEHAVAMVALNQGQGERDDGTMRWTFLKLREEENSGRRVLKVAACLPLGHPCLLTA